MAGNDQFCLRVKSFESNIKTSWKQMQMEDELCDIT